MVKVIAWLIVFPLCLVVAALVYRVAYQWYQHKKDARDMEEATARVDETIKRIEGDQR